MLSRGRKWKALKVGGEVNTLEAFHFMEKNDSGWKVFVSI